MSTLLFFFGCASDTATEHPPKDSCSENRCAEQDDKSAVDIENARTEEKRNRQKMIKNSKHPIPGTYFPVGQDYH